MPFIIPIILLLLSCLAASSQTTIQGHVKDTHGKPVEGASIGIKDSYDGATTDATGAYRFTTTETGKQLLTASFIGFQPYEQPVSMAVTTLTIDIVLKEEASELNAVVITAGTFEASDAKRTTVLNPIDIVTTASANADITAAIKTLPGAQQVGEQEGLFVRGGTAEETKIFIDGTLVNNFFFSSVPGIAQRGRFSPFLFKGTVFSSGGYSALYGQALSSALLLESIDLPEETSASLGISTVGLNAGYQKLTKNKKASWGASYSYTNLAAYIAVVKQRPDNFQVPEFHSADANFRIKTSASGMLKYYGYFNSSRLGIRRADIDSLAYKNAFSLKNSNFYHNLSWREQFGKGWRINIGTAYSYNTDDLYNELQDAANQPVHPVEAPFDTKTFAVKATNYLAHIKLVLEKKLFGLSAVRFGGEYLQWGNRSNYTDGYVSHATNEMTDHFKAAFGEADIYITTKLAIKAGGRFEHSSILDKANIAPRVSLAYKLAKYTQVSAAYGIFYQKPGNDFLLRNYVYEDLKYMKATHYIVNMQHVSRNYTLRIEGFYKKYNELVKTYSTSGTAAADSVANGGYGNAGGIELFWRDKHTFKNVDYWVSYSWLHTKRDYLNYPYALQPNFAADHTISLVLKKFVLPLKTSCNASYTFATGRPYYDIRYNSSTQKYAVADEGKTIPYNNLSLSFNYLPDIGKTDARRFMVLVFSINNVLGSDQVFGYNYSYNGLRKEPVLPTARRFFFLGCFLSFGTDRSDEIINSNL